MADAAPIPGLGAEAGAKLASTWAGLPGGIAAIALGGVGIYTMYAMYKMGLFKEKPMTEKQKSAITFAHIVLVLGEAIERLTDRCEKVEVDNKTLQSSNESLAKEGSQLRQEKSSLERQLDLANQEVTRLRTQLTEANALAAVRTATSSKSKKPKA